MAIIKMYTGFALPAIGMELWKLFEPLDLCFCNMYIFTNYGFVWLTDKEDGEKKKKEKTPKYRHEIRKLKEKKTFIQCY